jgi:uncharacterized membrane-anchored protein
MRSLVAGIAGALLFVVFAWSVVSKERILRDGTTVLVPLGPRDPRSLMQGDYMVLRYDVPDRIEKAAEQRGRRRGLLVMRLDPEGRASFQRIHEKGEELGSRERLIAYVWRGRRVDVGAPSFFFEEGTAEAYSAARFGELRLAASGQSVLVGLRDEQLQPLGMPGESEAAEE